MNIPMPFKYKFDHDWFSKNIPNLNLLHARWGYLDSKHIKILEIGSFEGKSTTFLLDMFPNSHITCIDTWEGGKDHDPSEIDFKKAEEHFDYNIKKYKDRVEKIKGVSSTELKVLSLAYRKFDFIYVDGAHSSKEVLEDLVLSFPMVNINGVIYCDDYLWGYNDALFNGDMQPKPFNTPKIAIDAFANIYRNKLCMPEMTYSGSVAFIKVDD